MVSQARRQALDTLAALLAGNALWGMLQHPVGRLLKREHLRH